MTLCPFIPFKIPVFPMLGMGQNKLYCYARRRGQKLLRMTMMTVGTI
jgi:hypothetical protein